MRKGTEKPIEIFVALFVILAVALVMLKLFQSQITEKQKQLADFQQEQKTNELKQKVSLHCQSKCTEASNNGCSLQGLAKLCLANSQQVLSEGEYLDLNRDNEVSYNVDDFGGEGVCEDKVFCFDMIDSCCARKITPKNCEQILKQFWKDVKGYNEDQVNALCTRYLNHGSCEVDPDLESLAWWKAFEGQGRLCSASQE